jgi:hypothetical protein
MSLADYEEIEKTTKSFQNDKASDISVSTPEKYEHLIYGHLSKLIDVFMESGTFPNSLKIANVTPILKKGDPQILENYRPISLLPIFGKIFEKIIYKRLYDFLISMNVIYDKQFFALEKIILLLILFITPSTQLSAIWKEKMM